MGEEIKEGYKPLFFSWCESYEQEEREMRETIEGKPSDERQLRIEYKILTDKRLRKRQ